MEKGLIAIVLAGQRPGEDRVATRFGLSARALIPVLGSPMIDHVLRALRASPRVDSVIVVEDPSLEPLATAPGVASAVADGFARLARARPKITESVAEVCREFGPERSYLVTTADNPLLTGATIDEFLGFAEGADVVVGMVDKSVIEEVYPETRRTYYRFRDAAVSGANLFYLSGAGALDAIALWSHVETHRKQPMKLFAKFGWLNLLRLATRRLTLNEVFSRLSDRVGCVIRPAPLSFPEAAIDVDKPGDLSIAEGVIASRRREEVLRGDAPRIVPAPDGEAPARDAEGGEGLNVGAADAAIRRSRTAG